jgi:predicted methyltransferase
MPAQHRCALAALAIALVAVACASASGTHTQETAAESLDQVIADGHRPAADRERDLYRHPKETLLFFGLRPQMQVVEIWPEPGWYTEIIAPFVKDQGKYYAAMSVPRPDNAYVTARTKAYEDKFAAHPELYGKIELTTFGPGAGEIAPPGSLDMVVTFRNIHNWMAGGWAPQAFAYMYKALKPGGILGVVEHRGNPALPQDPKAKSGYVREDEAIRLIESQGFALVAQSEINANPKDTKDYPQGVWTLPPVYRLGDKDKATYTAIGESDRFTLKFVKPKGK